MFTLKFKGTLSFVPIKFVPSTVPELPVNVHAACVTTSLTVLFFNKPAADAVTILSVEAPLLSVDAVIVPVNVELLLNVFAPAIVCVPVVTNPLAVVDASGMFNVCVVLLDEILKSVPEVPVDGGVLLFALALTVITGLVFGLAPALHATRRDLAGSAAAAEQFRARAGLWPDRAVQWTERR